MAGKGGAMPGAGRKSKAEELKAAEKIEAILNEIDPQWLKNVLAKVYEGAKKGSFKHQELLLAYRLGKPTDKIDLSGSIDGEWNITLNLDANNKIRSALGSGVPEENN